MDAGFSTRPRFVPGSVGDLFVLEVIPKSTILGSILIVPPFAEEMNRSRRMITLLAHRLAGIGYKTIVPDLFGTGDSSGSFGEARWEIWREDLGIVANETQLGAHNSTTVIGLRLGALLALDALAKSAVVAGRLILWSPCADGSQFATQFLRLRVMANTLSGSPSEETTASLRERLLQGGSIEVAGYEIASELFASIDAANISDLSKCPSIHIDWFEIVSEPERPFPVRSKKLAEKLGRDDMPIKQRIVTGPQFWTTPETATSPDLLRATTELFATG